MAPDSDFDAEDSDLDDDDDSSDVSVSDSDGEADDYNPFGGSDNEDPWCRSNKKAEKSKI